MSVPLYQAKAEFFRMPGHPVRSRVLDGPVPVRNLLTAIEVAPSRLSQQVAVLRRSGAGSARRESSTVVYERASGDAADLTGAAPRILTEIPAGQSELPAELREAEVAAR
ncbi:ArsR/SmtB family transcription factor [Streptomyces sp. NPDC058457]|uniref:ArsR/SmtB family transcription factor n=1 Tax=Streptomyces sp. NPDC058457 TaxID=3346507 RepID=UPI00365A6947